MCNAHTKHRHIEHKWIREAVVMSMSNVKNPMALASSCTQHKKLIFMCAVCSCMLGGSTTQQHYVRGHYLRMIARQRLQTWMGTGCSHRTWFYVSTNCDWHRLVCCALNFKNDYYHSERKIVWVTPHNILWPSTESIPAFRRSLHDNKINRRIIFPHFDCRYVYIEC